ncbi:DUF488 family protein [Streptomyces sp. ME02-8801-2C]|uniref:DUF488 domain-containing protein n=1 Tax=Streptomyces sp. ME02-8801-2C TaxID=3028680 RepID=UPI0029B187D1|nr:DUF488 family protein [Streptomyces sp. ME02-8801-2C]MDX3456497.1 DUF488 family protein [Streptomyces sp. ME02-8801-2C]
MTVRVRRVYEPPEPEDGTRVLVDRLWPRGLSKEAAHVDEWPKAITPSTELRRWHHAQEDTPDAEKEFRRRYKAELAEPDAVERLDALRALAGEGPVTLITATRSPAQSHASVLAELLTSGGRH